ncbi:hypothetical protein [Fulvivirga ligni]|uniref:hypothetical protein n=1 Tax=Fulvivirga ligni TaxID=2904246 RepID=UPI001F348422|nr:hypothetical protein [Fulvivirga ligni]UII22240.1 hypothetical protein LVD16_03220 [Fulvivirga ligni]
MTKKDFFILVIKILGLYLLIATLFSGMPSAMSMAFVEPGAENIFWIILIVGLIIGLFLLLIFKADHLVRLLQLDKGFDDERINLGSLNAEDIVKISLFLIGGFMIVKNIPSFISYCYMVLKSDIGGETIQDMTKFWWAVAAINVFIGFILITNYRPIAQRFVHTNADN